MGRGFGYALFLRRNIMKESNWQQLYICNHMIVWENKGGKVLFVVKWGKSGTDKWGWSTEIVKFD